MGGQFNTLRICQFDHGFQPHAAIQVAMQINKWQTGSM